MLAPTSRAPTALRFWQQPHYSPAATGFVLVAQGVNTTSSPSGVTANTPTGASSRAGNLLVLEIHLQSSSETVTSVTDNLGSTWLKAIDLSTSGSYTGIWYLPNCPAGITNVAATESLGTSFDSNVSEWSGATTSSPVRTTNTAAVITSPNRTGTVTTASGDLVIGAISANSSTARDLSAPFTVLTEGVLSANFTGKHAYYVTPGGTDEAQWTTASTANTGGVVAVFMPAIARHGSSQVFEVVTSTTSFAVTLAAGTQLTAGDYLWADLTLNGATTVTHPGSWTEAVAPIGSATEVSICAAYYKVTASDVTAANAGTLSFTWSGLVAGGRQTIIIQPYSNVDGTTPLDVTASSATQASGVGATEAATGITTVTNGCMLITGGGTDAGTTSSATQPSGFSMAGQSTGIGKRGGVADLLQITLGATGNQTWTFGDSNRHSVYLAALRPAVGGAPSTNAPADVAIGVGAALDPYIAAVEVATGTGAALDPYIAAVEVATGTGAAYDATVSTSAGTSAPAEVASGTGAALDPYVAAVEVATGTGAALDPYIAAVQVATGTGTALDPYVATVGVAAGTGAALDPYIAAVEVATGTGLANDATVLIGAQAPADVATGTGVALDPYISAVEVATGTGVANDATVSTVPSTQAPAEVASGTGAALDPYISAVEVAIATGAANNATVQVALSPDAGLASGTGVANDPRAIGNDIAVGVGVANDATVQVFVSAGVASGTAEPLVFATIALRTLVELAEGIGEAFDATIPGAISRDLTVVYGQPEAHWHIGGVTAKWLIESPDLKWRTGSARP